MKKIFEQFQCDFDWNLTTILYDILHVSAGILNVCFYDILKSVMF
jgi:hypothetical protein